MRIKGGQYMPAVFRELDKPKRKSAKQQVKECREQTINEAIELMKQEIRTKPKEWHRAYYSVITHLEMMKNGPQNRV